MLAFEWTTLVSVSLLVISKLSAITLLGKCRICNSMCLSWDIKPWKHHILAKLRNFAQTSSQHYSSQMFSPKLNNKNILSTSTFHILCLWSISIFIRHNINEEVRICATFNHRARFYVKFILWVKKLEHFQKVIAEGKNFHMVIPEMAIFKRWYLKKNIFKQWHLKQKYFHLVIP